MRYLAAPLRATGNNFQLASVTFILFRIYATAVVSGIGSVFGWCLCWWLLLRDIGHVWVWSLLGMLLQSQVLASRPTEAHKAFEEQSLEAHLDHTGRVDWTLDWHYQPQSSKVRFSGMQISPAKRASVYRPRPGRPLSERRSSRKVGSQPVGATPSDTNSFSKGGVYGTRKTGQAFHGAADRHVAPLEGGRVVA